MVKVSSQMRMFGRVRVSNCGPHHLEAGGIAECVNNAAVAAPPSRVSARCPSSSSNFVPYSMSLSICCGRFAHDHIDHRVVAEAVAGDERVFDVVLEGVFRRADAGNSTLCGGAVAFGDAVFGDNENGKIGRHFGRGRMPAMPAPMTRTSVKRWKVSRESKDTR